MLAYVKTYIPEWRMFWKIADSPCLKIKIKKANNKRLVCTSTRSSITLTAALKPAVENFNSKLAPRAKRTTPAPFQTTLCLLSVRKVYHTHPHTHSGPASARVLGRLPLPKATGRLQPVCLCVWYERMHVRHKNSIWKLLSSPIRDGCASARRQSVCATSLVSA